VRVTVLGAGESGRGVALLAQDLGFEVLVSDAGQLAASAKTELDDAGISYEQGGHSIDEIRHVDVVVKSPGIPWDADFVAFAKTSQVQVVGEMEFCARYAPSRMAQHKRIGITGSNGKTTTTLLTTHLLNTAGLSALEAGNVGTSYARCLLSPSKYEWIVLELSSFQLEDIEQFHCEIGMLLNLSPDHLDRYGGIFETYAQAKYKLLTSAQEGAVWLQPSDPVSLGLKPRVPEGVTVVEMPANFDAGIAKDIVGGERFELTNTPLGGPHNAANASFALTAVKLAGGESGVLAEALKNGPAGEILVTGGGAYNSTLVSAIKDGLAPSHTLYLPEAQLIDFKEALAFALLGARHVRGEATSLASVTGASKNSCGGEFVTP